MRGRNSGGSPFRSALARRIGGPPRASPSSAIRADPRLGPVASTRPNARHRSGIPAPPAQLDRRPTAARGWRPQGLAARSPRLARLTLMARPFARCSRPPRALPRRSHEDTCPGHRGARRSARPARRPRPGLAFANPAPACGADLRFQRSAATRVTSGEDPMPVAPNGRCHPDRTDRT